MEHAREEYEVSERRACRVVRQWRGTQRYLPLRRTDEDQLTQAILALAGKYGRYGYRRITALLRNAGWPVGTFVHNNPRSEPLYTGPTIGQPIPESQLHRHLVGFNPRCCPRENLVVDVIKAITLVENWSVRSMSVIGIFQQSARRIGFLREVTRYYSHYQRVRRPM